MSLLTPEEFTAKFLEEGRKQLDKEFDAYKVTNLLLKLAPWLGCEKRHVWNARDAASDGDVLSMLRTDREVGHLIPDGLIIGGHTGLKYGDVLSLKFRDKPWWRKLMGHIDMYGEVIWVLPMKGSGNWVIHNTVVSPDRRRPAIVIPAKNVGFNNIQVIRLELFMEEKSNE